MNLQDEINKFEEMSEIIVMNKLIKYEHIHKFYCSMDFKQVSVFGYLCYNFNERYKKQMVHEFHNTVIALTNICRTHKLDIIDFNDLSEFVMISLAILFPPSTIFYHLKFEDYEKTVITMTKNKKDKEELNKMFFNMN